MARRKFTKPFKLEAIRLLEADKQPAAAYCAHKLT